VAANRHIRKGTVLAFTSPKGVPAYVYVARRPPNANYGLGYVVVAPHRPPLLTHLVHV